MAVSVRDIQSNFKLAKDEMVAS